METHGLLAVDFTLLQDDNLWYLKQLELVDTEAQNRYLAMVGEVVDGDHMKVMKQIV